MLRVTLDIVPFGVESYARHIGTLEIARTTLCDDPEDYRVLVYATDGELLNIYTVKQHGYACGAWELTRRALEILTHPECY
jgi:hypothetical protein